MKKLSLLFLGLLLAALLVSRYLQLPPDERPHPPSAVETSDTVLIRAFEQRQSDIQVEGEGTVRHILADDNKGPRHQRFLLHLRSGQTVLVAHNIDLAPRLQRLAKGDTVAFFGEYEWNDKGGVIHWTHRDPKGRHVDGWLRYRGKVYQ